ncbi:Guanine nucleotide-binding protein subunit beta-2-like 1 [Hondaea fermentalgiana]|uniref:Pre-mRNA-processing factor 17 n=1 Tax=Hondaea fermentalgiana TaxID=2315210 RepID=A0A2R5H2E4_9STRA|nr:Guanine nucleotide-binding protein subunit beta-2-like 1 [Hondaea fermentalgiana]|eukprot:GBG34564.1 Guanine nucleotide-binding protein subunit beta-2-like 1 [Hondaea fermentalgiana]
MTCKCGGDCKCGDNCTCCEYASDSGSEEEAGATGGLENGGVAETETTAATAATAKLATQPARPRARLETAPEVGVQDEDVQGHATWALTRPINNENTKVIKHNLKASTLLNPGEGPVNPFTHRKAHVSEAAVDETGFDMELYKTMQHNTDSSGRKRRKRQRREEKREQDEALLQRALAGNGLWAAPADDEDEDESGPARQELSEEQKAYLAEQERKRDKIAKKAQEDADARAGTEDEHITVDRQLELQSTFHGAAETDYQGRSWLQPPPTLRPSEGHDAYIPKRVLTTFKGHDKGVSKIEFFPKYGHMLLSSSLDCTLKIWAVYESCLGGGRGLMRTYKGHKEPIRDHVFNKSGDKFVSSSYDRTMRVWDTETGQAIISIGIGSVANCVRFAAVDENLVLAGCSDRQILQYDLREGKVVQRYKHHDGAVNTITFFDEDRRFLTSADDKKLLVWDLNTPVPIKYISEASMQSMPFITTSPDKSFFACQSMDNQIVTYEFRERFRNYSKRFSGHNNAGFALPIDFSPNGKYLMSGDSAGKLFFWSWGSCKKIRELKVHSQPTQGAIWHPVEPSWVATCSWDGLIKLWE